MSRRALIVATTWVGTLVCGLTVGQSTPAYGLAQAASMPAVDQGATPAGWVPVDYGNAQLSVPASWSLLSGGAESCGQTTGVLIIGQGTCCPPGMGMAQSAGTSIVRLSVTAPTASLHGPHTLVNGIPLYAPGVASVYLATSLDAELAFTGPAQLRVLHTLTVSPRAIVLRSGGAAAIPPSWMWVSFDGLRFAVPPTWNVTHDAHAPPCGTDIVLPQSGVTLANGPALPLPCPIPEAEIRPVRQVPGIEVDGYKTPSQSLPTGTRCVGPRLLHSLPVCVDASPAYGVLIAQVRSAQSGPITVKIGMYARGIVAKMILHSIQRS
jgi:hypothetical protein